MKIEYGISTKDKNEVSYIEFVDTILDDLGFRKNMSGTRLLRDFSIFVYMENPLEIDLKEELKIFNNKRNTNIMYSNFHKKISNAIQYADLDKMKTNFYKVFRNEYDYYYLNVKTIITFIVNAMERNAF